MVKEAPSKAQNESDMRKKLGWLEAVKEYSWYLRELTDMMSRWYGGFLEKFHIFGSGLCFKILFSPLGRSVFNTFLEKVEPHGEPEGFEKLLNELLGEKCNWPSYYGGDINDSDSSPSSVSCKNLSKFDKKVQ